MQVANNIGDLSTKSVMILVVTGKWLSCSKSLLVLVFFWNPKKTVDYEGDENSLGLNLAKSTDILLKTYQGFCPLLMGKSKHINWLGEWLFQYHLPSIALPHIIMPGENGMSPKLFVSFTRGQVFHKTTMGGRKCLREYTGALSLLELLAIVKSCRQKELMVVNMIPEPVDALNHSKSEILNIRHLVSKPLILLMEEIRPTTWDVWNPANIRVNYISTGARFLPSTVLPLSMLSLVSAFTAIRFQAVPLAP